MSMPPAASLRRTMRTRIALAFTRAFAISLGSVLVLALYPTVMASPASGPHSACWTNSIPPSAPGLPRSGPVLVVSPTIGHVGSVIIISGSGWPANMPVAIDVEGTNGTPSNAVANLVGYASVQTDAAGTFAIQTTAPLSGDCGSTFGGPGTTAMFVAYTPNHTMTETAYFSYTGQPVLQVMSPSDVPQGNATTFHGYGFMPNVAVTLTCGTVPAYLYTAISDPGSPAPPETPVAGCQKKLRTDANGTFDTVVDLPGGLQPRQVLGFQATENTPTTGVLQTSVVEIRIIPSTMPSIVLSRNSGTVQNVISVTGSNWFPGDTIVLEYCRDQQVVSGFSGPRCDPSFTQALGQTMVHPDGSFVASVKLPPNAATGPITIQARVPNDVFGLAVYASGAPFQIVPPPPPWSALHPHLAFMLAYVQAMLPAGGLVLVLLGFYIVRRQRGKLSVV